MIRLDRVTKRYGALTAVDALSLEVRAGELLVLLGGSGCGKTTTLKMINRLIEPTDGGLYIDGRDTSEQPPHELRRRIGYAFQGIGLFPHMMVGENVGITLDLLEWEPERRRARIRELLELVELDPEEFATRFPHQLSGGQQQRVGLARALAAGPKILLLDEPFGALDPLTRDRLQRFFQDLRARLGLTVIFVTHDMVEGLLLGDRIAVMQEGRLVQIGTAHELLSDPASPYVAELMDTPRRQADRLEALVREEASGSRGTR
jgi:osmoprotectant transport system ATP-binding protein